MLLCVIFTVGSAYRTDAAETVLDGPGYYNESSYTWQNDGIGWWYGMPSSSGSFYYADKWLDDDGNWYYFDNDGYMKTGWLDWKDGWYYFDPEMTNARFVQNPLESAWPDRIYRTGDIAGYNEYGELVYIGREDTQIKHLGYRIELGEIETAAASLDTVESCACIYDYGKKQIIFIYSGNEIPQKEFSKALAERIPKYMMPNRYIYLREMPRNMNGKTDRAKLKELYT